MLPTFVIGLREGLEAALIVGIIAAFLRKQGRRDLLRWVFLGVAVAIALCVAAGVALNLLSKNLPQEQQEGLETVIGVLAVGMVTYMVFWMRRNSRNLKGQLEGLAADALGGRAGAARAMVLMAFLAVLREGIETVVFLLAAFDQSSSGSSSAIGAVLGIVVAVLLGYGIYRGGVHINLSKFFRVTGLVLVLVAAGILVNALHTAHEAGWLEAGQGGTIDLSGLVSPGSVQASLLTGMLGVQSHPVVIEVVGWLAYLVPVGLFVAWPPGRGPARRTSSRLLLGAGVLAVVGAGVLALVAPARPAARPVTGGDTFVSGSARTVVVSIGGQRVALRRSGPQQRGGVDTVRYALTSPGSTADSLPTRLSIARVAALNGGRLPIGLAATSGTVPVHYVDTVVVTAWIEPRTRRIVDVRRAETVLAAVVSPNGSALALSRPVSSRDTALPATTVVAAGAAAVRDLDALDRRTLLDGLAATAGVLGLLMLIVGAALGMGARRRPDAPAVADAEHMAELVQS